MSNQATLPSMVEIQDFLNLKPALQAKLKKENPDEYGRLRAAAHGTAPKAKADRSLAEKYLALGAGEKLSLKKSSPAEFETMRSAAVDHGFI